jgi:hypothetical protein
MLKLAAALLLAIVSPVSAEIPKSSFFSGNDVYDWCQHDHAMALGYTAGQFDGLVHAAYTIDSMRPLPGVEKKNPNAEIQVDVAINSIVGFCMPEHATTQQITDVFCKYLRDMPGERDGLPAIILNRALTKVWPPCH